MGCKVDFSPFLSVHLAGIFYYLAIFLNTQAMEFRYYAPAFPAVHRLRMPFIAVIGDAILTGKRKSRMSGIKPV